MCERERRGECRGSTQPLVSPYTSATATVRTTTRILSYSPLPPLLFPLSSPPFLSRSLRCLPLRCPITLSKTKATIHTLLEKVGRAHTHVHTHILSSCECIDCSNEADSLAHSLSLPHLFTACCVLLHEHAPPPCASTCSQSSTLRSSHRLSMMSHSGSSASSLPAQIVVPAPVPAPSTLSAKIEALEGDLKELKGKITTLDVKITALDVKITALDVKIQEADEAGQADQAASLRAEQQPLVTRRDKLEDDMKQLRAMLIEYQHEKNLLLEAQQRAQQQSTHGQFMLCHRSEHR